MNLTREKLLVAKVNMVNSILFYTLCQVKTEIWSKYVIGKHLGVENKE